MPYEMEWSPAIVAEARQVIEQKYELIGRQTSGGAGMRAWRNNAKREYVIAVEGITFSHEGLDCRQDEREVSGADGPQMLPEAGNL